MEDLEFLTNGSILIDTCFLIDSGLWSGRFASFIEILNEKKVAKLSISLVRSEFVMATSKTSYDQKLRYFETLIDGLLPIDSSVELLTNDLIAEYSQDIKGVSPVDLYLGGMIKRYKLLYLLTKNHSDFPERLFTRKALINFELPKAIWTYALYQYKEE